MTRKAFMQALKVLFASVLLIGTLAQAEPKLYYVHTDHLGTPRVLTDENQTVVWQADYTPFGEATVDEDPDGDGVVVEMPLRFPGQYFDKETGLHYNWHRDYDPTLGRYIQSDPIGLAGGLNTYGYAYQNPVMNIDPDGRFVIVLAHPATWAALGKTAAFVGSAALAAWGANEAINYYNESASDGAGTDKAEKARERKEYSRICKTPIPPTGDPCTDAKNNLNRLKQCLQLRENFSRKWYNDSDTGHMTEIQNTRTAIKNLESWIRDNCGGQCE